MFQYILIENGVEIYKSNDFEVCAHEYFSILNNYLKFINKYNSKFNADNDIENLCIRVNQIVDNKKRYPIEIETYFYNFTEMKFTSKNKENNIKVMKNYNKKLESQILELINLNKNIVIPTNKKVKQKSNNFTEVRSDELNLNKIIKKTMENAPLNNNIELDKDEPLVLDEDFNPENMEEMIKQLEEMKQEEEKKIREVKEQHIMEAMEINEEALKLEDIKREEKNKKNIQEEKIRKYNSDKSTYKLIKKDIGTKLTENNIPVLFRQQYPIFKFMEELNYIEKESSFDLYTELYKDLYMEVEEDLEEKYKWYTPLNYSYLSENEKEKCMEFISKNKSKIESLDEILKKLDKMEHTENKKLFTENTFINSEIDTKVQENNTDSISKIEELIKSKFI